MVEQGNFVERYAQISPQERNVEFRHFFGQLPAEPSFEVVLDRGLSQEEMDKMLFGSMDKRPESEHKILLLMRLKALLKHSCFTISGQQHLTEQFGLAYNTGVPKSGSELSVVPAPEDDLEVEGFKLSDMIRTFAKEHSKHPNFPVFLLEEENPDSAGIFDSSRGELEWRFYDWYVASMNLTRDMFMRRVQERSEPAGTFMQDYYSKLDLWQAELIIKHGEKPRFS